MEVIFRMFDDAAREFKQKKITVTLGGTVKNVFIVPVLLYYMKGDHKVIRQIHVVSDIQMV